MVNYNAMHTILAFLLNSPAQSMEASVASTTKEERTIGGKGFAQVQMDDGALLKEREEECPERKKRNGIIRNHWVKKVMMLDKKNHGASVGSRIWGCP